MFALSFATVNKGESFAMYTFHAWQCNLLNNDGVLRHGVAMPSVVQLGTEPKQNDWQPEE